MASPDHWRAECTGASLFSTTFSGTWAAGPNLLLEGSERRRASSRKEGNMWRLVFLALTVVVASPPSLADDLSRGVLLVHHPAGLQYSSGTDYCTYAGDSLSFPNCWEDVNPTVPADTTSSVWFVIAAWEEPEEFLGAEFGFGSYAEDAYLFVDYGPCLSGQGLEIADDGWPGPVTGTAITSTVGWSGAFVPVYFFAGYGYAEAEIAIQGRSGQSEARVSDETMSEIPFRTDRCGILGIGREGVRVCPGQDIATEVLVWFAPGGFELPPETTHSTLEAATFASADVDTLLMTFGVNHVSKTFPSAVQDTVGFRSGSGRMVYRTDFTNHCTLVTSSEAQAESVAASLQTDASIYMAVSNGGEIQQCIYPNEFGILSIPFRRWHLENDGSSGCVPDVDIDAPEAWNIECGDEAVHIAIVDAPVAAHLDLRELSQEYEEGSGHGMQVAGLVGAATDNGIGIAAVDWSATLGSFDYVPYLYPELDWAGMSDLIRSACAAGNHILNCSWGSRFEEAEFFRPAFIDAYKEDILTVAAIGNYPTTGMPVPLRPGLWDQGVLTVGAIDCRGEKAIYSMTGAQLDVVAPGESLYTTTMNDDYDYFRGTSAATPVVSGIASLLRAYAQRHQLDLCVDDVMQLVRLGAVDLEDAGWDSLTGWGCANAYNSLYILADSTTRIFRHLTLSSSAVHNIATEVDTADYDLCQVPSWGVDSVFTGRLTLTKYEVRRETHNLGGPVFTTAPPIIWGRGRYMYGYGLDCYEDEQIMWGYGFCDTVGTPTDSSAVLRTWVYYDDAEDRWFPCPPEEVTWAYGLYSGADLQRVADDRPQVASEGMRWWVNVRSPQHGGANVTLRLPSAAQVKVSVFDVQGRMVRRVADDILPRGTSGVHWDGRGEGSEMAGSGLYWLRVESPWGVETRRFIMVR